jgi:hypothetical protein
LKTIMNISRIALAALVLSTVGAAHAQSGQTGLTRDQVRAELAEAQRRGELPTIGDLGRTPREISPDRYPARQAGAVLTRAEVVAELAQAHRNGDLPIGDTGLTQYDIAPQNFPHRALAQGVTRAQVRAELSEAQRIGDIVANDERGGKLNELYPQRYAMVLHDTTAMRVSRGPTAHH